LDNFHNNHIAISK